LSDASRRIGDASARTESDILRLAERGEAVLSLLGRWSGRFGFQEEIGQALGEVRDDLTSLAHHVESCGPDIRTALCKGLAELQASYTMDQERIIQSAFMDDWGLGAETMGPTASTSTAPADDLEDILF